MYRTSRASRRPYTLEFIVIAAYAVFAIGYFINTRSLWLDEAISVSIASQPYECIANIITHVDAVHALYYSTLHSWLLFGHSAIAIRSLSAILALLALPVMAMLARATFGKDNASASVAVLATSVFYIFYADEARSIAFTILASSLAALAFVRALSLGRPIDFALFGLCATVVIYVDVLSVFFVGALILSVAVMQPSRNVVNMLALTSVLVAVAIIPLAYLIHLNSTVQIDWIKRSRPSAILHFIASILGGDGGVGRAGLLSGFFEATVVFCLMVLSVVNNWSRETRSIAIAATIWFVAPLVAGILVDRFVQPILVARYFSFVLIPATLLAGDGLTVIGRRFRPIAAYVIVAVLAALTFHSISTVQREDWRGVARLLADDAKPGEAILLWAPAGIIPLRFAMSEETHTTSASIVYPTGPIVHGVLYSDPRSTLVDQVARHYRTVWLVLSHDTTHGTPKDPFMALSRAYAHVTTHVFSGVRVVTYGK